MSRLVEQVQEIRAKGAWFAMATELHREQTANGTIKLKQGSRQARWGR